ncbi:protein ROT1 [Lipomyces oligophaga]|uniref:protein ROT1 n=1 Tax=Lipomyces oligophaga TaxID=45792 RepID=UPI0034CEE15B
MIAWTLVTLLVATFLGSASAGDNITSLTGTWSSKSRTVFTGPGFYDPVDELLIEPRLPGMSLSFTDDGHYEEAYYIVKSNPSEPGCPVAVLQFQHGTYSIETNGSIILTPISVDGRQLLSEPCDSTDSEYTRYDQWEIFTYWEIYIDTYHGEYRLDLKNYEGDYVKPLYLVYRPPLMLPTVTMNPTTSSTGSGSASSTASAVSTRMRLRRSFENRKRTNAVRRADWDADKLWWSGMLMMITGGVGYCFVWYSSYMKA